MMLLIKAVVFGSFLACLACGFQLGLRGWQLKQSLERQGLNEGLGAAAGGLNYVVQEPLTIALATAAFGVGFWLAVRR